MNHLSYTELSLRLQNAQRSLAILPVGCYEQHGPILPLGTDSIIAEALAHDLAVRLRPEFEGHVFPPIHFTPTEPNRDFCGTVHVSYDEARPYFQGVLASLLRHSFGGVLIVNGHGSVDGALKEVAFRAVYAQFSEGKVVRPVLTLNAFEFAGAVTAEFGQAPGRHAEWTEFLLTFHLLGRAYYTPERLTCLEEFARQGERFHHPQPAILGIPMELRSQDGVHGHPLPPDYSRESLEEMASRLFELLSAQLAHKARHELLAFEERFQTLQQPSPSGGC